MASSPQLARERPSMPVVRGPRPRTGSCRTELRRAGVASALPEATVSVHDLGLQRGGRWLFRGLSWELLRGKVSAVTGRSGAGKSSLLACLAGMLPPTEGRVEYRCHAECVHSPEQFQARIGIVFQDLMLTPRSSLLTNVLCGRLGRYPWWRTALRFPRQDRQEAYDLLAHLGIEQYVYRPASEVSGGEQQRAAVARALFQQPEVFLVDEPVSNLDAANTELVLSLLRQQAHQQGRTVVCVLHDEALVRRFADHELHLDAHDPRGWSIRDVRR
jgi:phosphonate transport system ATP-binding protein